MLIKLNKFVKNFCLLKVKGGKMHFITIILLKMCLNTTDDKTLLIPNRNRQFQNISCGAVHHVHLEHGGLLNPNE